MAVEAHRLLHHAGATGAAQRQALPHAAGWAWAAAADAAYYCDKQAPPASVAHQAQAQPRRSPACYGGAGEVAAARPAGQQQQQGHAFQYQHQQQQQQPSCAAGLLAAPAPPQYAAAAESGVTFGGGAAAHAQQQGAMALAPRKRKRADGPPALGLDVAAHLQQQLLDVDRLVLQHTAKMWAALTEQRRRHARQVVAAVEAAAAKRLRAKDEELERVRRLNWALEERVGGLYVEAQVWRDLAQSNEAAANALRGELQHALDAQQRAPCALPPGAGAGADDAESCCCGENDVAAAAAAEGEEAAGGETSSGRRTAAATARCRVCGEGAAEVLLLPCRHLCACAPCAGAAVACPACGCAKNGTVCVNFS